jgi:hypothetical protein
MRDMEMLRFASTDLLDALRSLAYAAKALARGARPEISDETLGILRGTVPGMIQGWREFGETGDRS